MNEDFTITTHVASDGTVHQTRTLTEEAKRRRYAEMITYESPDPLERQKLYYFALVPIGEAK